VGVNIEQWSNRDPNTYLVTLSAIERVGEVGAGTERPALVAGPGRLGALPAAGADIGSSEGGAGCGEGKRTLLTLAYRVPVSAPAAYLLLFGLPPAIPVHMDELSPIIRSWIPSSVILAWNFKF